MAAMRNKISLREYRRRVFNHTLLECLCKLNKEILNGTMDDPMDYETEKTADKFCRSFYEDELHLQDSTVRQTRERLSEAAQFVQELCDTCEEIADEKMEVAEEEGMEPEDDQEIELSEEDKEVVNQIFDIKKPDPEIDHIRDSTVAALVAEDQRAQEVKQALDISQSQVDSGQDPEALEETMKRLDRVGPTSIMNSLLNYYSGEAVRLIHESGSNMSIKQSIGDNRDKIKAHAVITYVLMETAHTLNIHRLSPTDIRNIASDLYFSSGK